MTHPDELEPYLEDDDAARNGCLVCQIGLALAAAALLAWAIS